MPGLRPFHLAFPVTDLQLAREFYTGLLGCEEGRSAERWVDFNFYGHQLVAHLVDARPAIEQLSDSNPVDGHDVPVPHFGVVLAWEAWHSLAQRLELAGVAFVIAPGVRFRGQKGEQATLFFLDPFANALEFKAFRNEQALFAV